VNVLVQASANIVARVLSHPAVTDAMASAITEGMNKFMRQPDLDGHVKVMMDTMSNMQPEIARKKGEEFHNSVASFIQGIINPRKEDIGATEALKVVTPTKTASSSSPPSKQVKPAVTKSASSSLSSPPTQGGKAEKANGDTIDPTNSMEC